MNSEGGNTMETQIHVVLMWILHGRERVARKGDYLTQKTIDAKQS